MAVDLSKTKSMNNIKNIAQKGIEESNNKVVKNIPLDQIDFNPDNLKIFSMRNIEGLERSIEEVGFTGAIEVYLKPDGRYQISSGHRRYQAMKNLKRKTISCIVTAMEEDATVRKKLVESNINTRVMSPMELASSIIYYENALLEENFKGQINKKIAEVFSISETKVDRLKSISKMIDGIKEMAQNVNFPYEAFYEARYFSTENQKKLCSLIENHTKLYPNVEITSLVVNQYINQIKNELKAEAEKKEREKILEQSKKDEIKETGQKVPATSTIETESLETLPVQQVNDSKSHDSETGDNPEIIKYDDDVKDITSNTSSKEKFAYIDFDLRLYTEKLDNITKRSDIKIKEQKVRIETISKLQEIISKLKKM